MNSHEAAIAEIEREMQGEVSLAARNLTTGETILYQPDRWVKTASVIKLPLLAYVALAVQEGTLDWNETMILTAEEKVGGSGVLAQLTPGLTLSLRDVCVLMTVISDNTATNMIIEKTGVAPVNDCMRALGLPVTTLTRKAYSTDAPTELSQKYGLGVTTPNEMLTLMTRLAEGNIGEAETSAGVLRILEQQQYTDGIPRLLPADWKYAGKTGAVDRVRNDVGLVTGPDGQRIALAIFCQELPYTLWTADNPGLLAIARLSRWIVGAFTGLPLETTGVP
jgi:beta-lactamase class A